jgi:outer membrane receptor protein involved in Fe transport
MSTTRRSRYLVGAVALVLLPAAAPAQTAPGGVPSSAAPIQEIVVTAEKRASTVQDTPISITALTGDQLEEQGISGVQGLVQQVPGLSMRTAGPGQTELELRGLSSSGGASPTVGFYLNDYPVTPPAAALNGKVVIDPDLYDVNRVEVLRGPQGTLYGSGSMGGTVKIVTDAPKLNVFEGSVAVNGAAMSGGGFNRGIDIAVNLPLVDDKVALRLVGTDKFRDGWITRTVEPNFPPPTNPNGFCAGIGWPGCTRGNVQGGSITSERRRSNWDRTEGGRAELLVEPNSDIDIRALVMVQKITTGAYDEYDLPPGNPNTHYQADGANEPVTDQFHLYGLTAIYHLPFADLTSATAYFTRNESQTQDVAEALYSLLPVYGYPINQFTASGFNETDSSSQLSEEIRLASIGEGPLQWIGGFFYSQFKSVFAEYNASIPILATIPGVLATNPLGILYEAHNPYHMHQYAVFGEANYSFLEHWKLTAGLRWYDFDSHALDGTAGLVAPSGTGQWLYNAYDTANTGINPKITLSYQQDHDLTLYGTAARGFRPGGINQQIPAPPCNLPVNTYGPDSIWNYELGEKAKLLDGRLVVNADVFYVRWAKVQQFFTEACGYPVSANAGTAASYGPELEVTAALTPSLRLSVSGTYTHANLVSINAALVAQGVAFAPGEQLYNVPRYTETTALTYIRPITDEITLTARINNSYVGPMPDQDYSPEILPTYDIVGARVGFEWGNFLAMLYADNVTDKRAMLGINTTGFAYTIPSLIRVVGNQPRTVGLNVKYRF